MATSETLDYDSSYLERLLDAVVVNLRVGCGSRATSTIAISSPNNQFKRLFFQPAIPIAPSSDLSLLPSMLSDNLFGRDRLHKLAIIDDDGHQNIVRLSYRSVALISWKIRTLLKSAVSGKTLPRVVAVVMHKGWEQAVSVIGVIRAHATYLPIDAAWPETRIEQLLKVSGAVAVIHTKNSLGNACTNLPTIEVSESMLMDEEDTDSIVEASGAFTDGIMHKPRDLAYLIYTSGSTGKPKGVCCHHQGAINTNVDLVERFEINNEDRVLGLSSQSFDLSVFDVFGMLGAGGTLVLASERDSVTKEPKKVGPDPQRWIEMVEKHQISVWNTVPAFMELIVNYCEQDHRPIPASLRLVMMSGDWIPPTLPGRIHAMSANPNGIRVISLGGATEAAIWSNMFEVKKGWNPSENGWSCIPYGRPLRNQTMYILNDETMEHCEPWVTGVIYIGGAGVALGYFNDKQRTEKQFIVHPRTGEYLFRTGDLGRLRPDGELEILGREDSQVKVNGYRIELGELEKVAVSDERVVNCCAVVSQAQETPQLVVFYTCDSGNEGEDASEDTSIQSANLMVEEVGGSVRQCLWSRSKRRKICWMD